MHTTIGLEFDFCMAVAPVTNALVRLSVVIVLLLEVLMATLTLQTACG